mgnify:CR=1 FL=1
MAREENYDQYGSPLASATGSRHDSDNLPIAAYLSFDNASYTDGNVPCQALAGTFFVTGLSYHVKDENGVNWSVNKKHLKELMEQRYYVWVCADKAMRLGVGVSLQVQATLRQGLYAPKYKSIMTPEQLQNLTSLESYRFKLKGRKRRYYANGRTGPGINMNRVRTPEQDQAAHQASDDVWARAHEQARGY